MSSAALYGLDHTQSPIKRQPDLRLEVLSKRVNIQQMSFEMGLNSNDGV